VYEEWRRLLRPAIEKELLGRTLDQGDPAERLAAQAAEDLPTPAEIMALAEERVDVLLLLRNLNAAEAATLLAYHAPGANHNALAAELGVSPEALRVRMYRALRRVRRTV
jgi:DNA-directed RNA polymerase specialized sigma24 family protein